MTRLVQGIGAIVLPGGCAITFGNPALAQTTPDATLRTENSNVTPIPGGFQINGGATRKPPTIRQAMIGIAHLGGFLARPGDGEPGLQTFWRGFSKFHHPR